MARYRVDPRVVKGVSMRDGTDYTPSRDGWVHVAAKHDSEMSTTHARRSHTSEAQVTTAILSGQGIVGRICPKCSMSCWAWQTNCGKCNTRLK